MPEYWLWYTEKNLTASQKRMILEYFENVETIYLADRKQLWQIEGMTEQICQELLDKDLTQARKMLRHCGRVHVQILGFYDEKYPQRLRSLYDAPAVLYYQGVLPDWNRMPVIGIVGTRKATAYGTDLTKSMSSQIATCGGMVISGGALGIDTVALQSALESGGTVVAVLAGGLDKYYPAANTSLFHKICSTGCLITEYPPGTPSNSWNFPVRNRIISGISNGLLVVEAPVKSGALISARHAMEQGRDVFAVPGNVNAPTCEGTNLLLQEGARVALSGWDVLKEYAQQYPDCVQYRQIAKPVTAQTLQVAQTVAQPMAVDKIRIDNQEKSTYSVEHNANFILTEQEQSLLACIGRQGDQLDDVIIRSGLNAAEAKMLITRLSLKKVLVLHPGGRITLN